MALSQPSIVVVRPDPSPAERESLQAQEAGTLDARTSSSESIASSQLAQDNAQPHVVVEEGTTTETDQLLPNDELQSSHRQEAPPAADVNRRLVEGRTLDGRANKDLVTLPLATLQKLVEYCAQVVRESKELKTRIPDLERGGLARTTPADPSSDEELRGIDCFNPDDIRGLPWHESVLVLLNNMWKEVIPFKLAESLDPADGIAGPEESMLLTRCLGEDDIDCIFRPINVRHVGDVRGDVSRFRHLIHAWETRVPVSNHPVPFNYRVVVVLLEGLDHGRVSIGAILQRCYQLRVLTQPDDSRPSNYYDHIWLLMLIVLTLNTVFRFYCPFEAEYLFCHVNLFQRMFVEIFLTRRRTLEEVFGLTVLQLCHALRAIGNFDSKTTPLEAAGGPNFRVSDLNIESLRALGGLKILWTHYLEDHLRLDLSNRTLSVLWQDPSDGLNLRTPYSQFEEMLINSLRPEYLDAPENTPLGATQLSKEVHCSWSILFTTANVCTRRNIANYKQMPKRAWMSGDGGDYQRSKHLASYYGMFYPEDDRISKRRMLKPYSEFIIFENRIRHLVHYMDTQKPQGFRQLWRDKRDTLSYYTFWGVIIFGGLSVFLALFSLAVSIAQMVASFRALDLGASTVPPSG